MNFGECGICNVFPCTCSEPSCEILVWEGPRSAFEKLLAAREERDRLRLGNVAVGLALVGVAAESRRCPDGWSSDVEGLLREAFEVTR